MKRFGWLLILVGLMAIMAGIIVAKVGVESAISEIPQEQREQMDDFDWIGVEWIARGILFWLWAIGALVVGAVALVFRPRLRKPAEFRGRIGLASTLTYGGLLAATALIFAFLGLLAKGMIGGSSEHWIAEALGWWFGLPLLVVISMLASPTFRLYRAQDQALAATVVYMGTILGVVGAWSVVRLAVAVGVAS